MTSCLDPFLCAGREHFQAQTRTKRKFNKKHNITGRTYAATKAAVGKAQEINEQYGVTKKIETAAVATAKKASEVNNEYKITDKAGAALGAGLDAITKAANGTLPPEGSAGVSSPDAEESVPVVHATLKN